MKMLKKKTHMKKYQGGFTLVEVIIAVAITGLIIGGVAFTFTNLVKGNAQSNGEMVALFQVQNAGHQIIRDAKMAGGATMDVGIIPGDDDETSATEVLTILWEEIDSWKTEDIVIDGEVIDDMVSKIIKHKIVYTLDGGILDRSEYTTGIIREDADEEDYTYALYTNTRVAQYITILEFNMGTKQLKVTAETGGFQSQKETRTYEVEPRPEIVYGQ